MRRKLQYPSLSSVINVPVPYPVVPGGDFPKFDLVLKPKPIQLGSFNNLVVIPTPYPVVPGGDFSDFDLVQKPKPTQLGSFTNTVYQPVATVVFQPYIFSQFEQPQPRKGFTYSFDDGWTGTGTPVQSFVFTTFSQPQVVKVQSPQLTFVGDLGPAQTPSGLDFADFDLIQSKRPQQEEWVRFQIFPPAPVVVQPYVFTAFGQPQPPKPFQENVFNSYEATQLYFQPVFSAFEQPRFKQVRQDPEVQFTIFPITQAVVFQPYVFSSFEQPSSRKVLQPVNTVQPIFVPYQPYVFSRFEQPQFKKQSNDQPTWFSSTVVLQPYVFSAFSQPRPLRYQTDTNVQTSYYPIVVIPPPNFTGFNDFGLAQQLLGTQQKQDGGYIQFTVLPMPQVISPYFFTGFSSFQELLPNTSTRQRGLLGLGSSFDNVIIPVVQIIPPPDVIVGGGGYRFMGGYNKYDRPQTIHTDAVRKAAAVLSKMGGEARAKSLTPTQRSNIATTAANTRWNPKK